MVHMKEDDETIILTPTSMQAWIVLRPALAGTGIHATNQWRIVEMQDMMSQPEMQGKPVRQCDVEKMPEHGGGLKELAEFVRETIERWPKK